MSRAAELRTYDRKDAVVFRKTNERFGGLSNMASGFPLEVNGVRILTSEALYQACRFPHKPEVQRLIIQQTSPMTAKMRSKPHRKDTRSDWEKVRVNIMRWCLRAKLAQNWQKFGELLLATGDRQIVEESRKDDFWGAKGTDEATLVGINVLGRLLMELREELRSPDRERLRRVEPLAIPQFLLFGKPIGVVEVCARERAGAELFGEPVPVGGGDKATTPLTSGYHKQKPEAALNEEGAASGISEEIRSNGVIPKECKRLAEVDFPIAAVSKHSAREKSIRHGHPSTLHLWWARRPLAACRGMLLGLLWPDPCDRRCPEGFKLKARELLPSVQGRVGPTDEDLRKALLKFIADFANWDLSANRNYLDISRRLVKAAHGDEPPLIVDPFAGGGSIPLEALRLGCEAFGSDLNPVACLILKVMLEDIPRHGLELAQELRRVGAEIKREAEKELADLYPMDPDGAGPITYLWARTVRCESPNCGAEIPLMRSFWLAKKANRKRALRYRIHHRGTEKKHEESRCPLCLRGEYPHVAFEVFEPKAESEVPAGTVTRAKAKCLCCGAVLPPERVRAQLAAQRGGADVTFDEQGRRTGGARLLAVVTLKPGETGRHYRLPTERDYEAVRKAQARVAKLLADWERGGKQGLCPVPDEPLPPIGTLGFRVQRYGMLQWGDLFTARQKVALVTLVGQASRLSEKTDNAVREAMALVVNRCADRLSTVCRWDNPWEKVANTFSRQALPFVWDFCEGHPYAGEGTGLEGALDWVAKVAEAWPRSNSGQLQPADATEHPLPDETAHVWFTDPPYYDAVPYADLSDFFLVWLKRALPGHQLLRDPFDPKNSLTPKSREAVQNERSETKDGRPKDKTFYEEAMAKAFAEGRRVLREEGVGAVVFAHKTTEGWEALLSGMIRGGWTITGSWPIATEMGSRLRAQDSAALATSVHLICRPRPDDAPIGDWASVLRELPARVADWMEQLQHEGVRGADLVFACIGPALEIFSRYSRVETADGREVKLAEYLEKVWEVVGRSALEQVLGTAEAKARNGAAGAVEEDARLTALFLWTLQSTNGGEPSPQPSPHPSPRGRGDEEEEVSAADDDEDEEETASAKAKGYTLVFDVVRRFAQPLGINLPKWEGRIIETKKGVVRLFPVAERTRILFGKDGAEVVAQRLEKAPAADIHQLMLFTENDEEAGVKGKGRGRGRRKAGADVPDEALETSREATTLDRVHMAMLLQAGGRANALRALLKAEQERGPEFLRLANALSALYPKGSEEKRLLDAMLLAVPR
ncbi:MAG: NADAR domain-containing protein [Nitrospirota bacterium]